DYLGVLCMSVFFFSSRRRHTRLVSDWSSDVCSSDLSIVNVVSSGVLPVAGGGGYFGLRPYTLEMPYQATKAAVTALTFYLADERSEERRVGKEGRSRWERDE